VEAEPALVPGEATVGGAVAGEFLRIDVELGSGHRRDEGVSLVARSDPRCAPRPIGSFVSVLRSAIGGEVCLDTTDGNMSRA
jgi:hypothetical protein